MDFEDSVAALTAKEAMKIELALQCLEEKMYVPVEAKQPEEDVIETEHDVYRDYMQSTMVGYSAHTEEVTEEEILLWQRNFFYLQVRGEAMLELDPDFEENTSNAEDDLPDGVYFHSMPDSQPREGREESGTSSTTSGGGKDKDFLDLRVGGVAARLTAPPLGSRDRIPSEDNAALKQDDHEEEEEEVLVIDGQLEETLCIDRRPAAAALSSSSSSNSRVEEEDIHTSIEPVSCQQAEVVNSLVDVIFPDIVAFALRPLVASVVRAGREHGVRYQEAGEEAPLGHPAQESWQQEEQGEEQQEECMFFSGEGGAEEYGDNDRRCSEDGGGGGGGGGGGFLVIPDGWD
jgi:hypothetical protein